MIEIKLHTALQRFVENKAILRINVTHIVCEDLVSVISSAYPALSQYLIDNTGNLTPYINIYVNRKDFRQLDNGHKITSADHLEILTSLVGG